MEDYFLKQYYNSTHLANKTIYLDRYLKEYFKNRGYRS